MPPPAPVPVTGTQAESLPYRVQAIADDTDLHALLLGVSRVERTADGQTVWAFVYNGTSRAQRISLRHRVRDGQGRETDGLAYCPPGRAATLNQGHVLYLWPTFRFRAAADDRLELSVDVEGYGRLRVPLTEQRTNLGAWDDLPAGVRSVLADAFKSDGAFRWWGE
ncbi:MAG: hypothetical protein FJX76_08300 [Armatimonadetes bacterium]|nr:hypothetical protein [Armatimonadota bacterium]